MGKHVLISGMSAPSTRVFMRGLTFALTHSHTHCQFTLQFTRECIFDFILFIILSPWDDASVEFLCFELKVLTGEGVFQWGMQGCGMRQIVYIMFYIALQGMSMLCVHAIIFFTTE